MSSIAQTIFKKLIIAIAAFVLVTVFSSIRIPLAQETGIITVNDLNLRPKPGTSEDPIGKLPKGAEVRILEQQGDWLRISYQEVIGYVLKRPEYIHIIPDKNRDTLPEIEKYREEATGIEKQLEASKTELRSFQKKETDLLNSLNEIDLRINQHRKEISRLHRDTANLDESIALSRKEYHALDREIAAQEKYAEQRLVALYKTLWLGHSHIVASAETMYEMFQRRKALESILGHDANLLDNLEQNRLRLEELLEELNDRQRRKMDAETEMRHQVRLEEHVKKERRSLLQQIRKKKSEELAVMAALQRASEKLDKEITALSRQAETTGKDPGDSTVPFVSRKGLLPLPVKGKIIFFFGPYRHPKFNVVNFRSGIDIRAERGEVVTAVGSGRVIFSNWFKGYGNMVIIDHGQNYHTVYAYLEERFKSKDDLVSIGEVIGTAGETGSLNGPGVHFEVRHHGKPVDPVQWIKKG
jgi:murein hydrolase activator